jgi:hypothetical protein
MYIGKEVSLFVKDFYARELLLLDSFNEFNIKKALIASFHHIDDMLNNPVYMYMYMSMYLFTYVCMYSMNIWDCLL